MILNETTIPFIIIGIAAFVFLVIYARAFFAPIGGIWFEKKDEYSEITKIHLSHFGPWVWGVAEVPGGTFRYKGWFNGRSMRLRRNDSGKGYFGGLGFPEEVFAALEGTEMARAQFVYNHKKQILEGEHFPQKIDISRTRPPRIAGRIYLPAVPRKWTRKKPSPPIPRPEEGAEESAQTGAPNLYTR